MINKSLYGALFTGLNQQGLHDQHHAMENHQHHRHHHEQHLEKHHEWPEHLHKLKFKKTKSHWNAPSPFKVIKDYISWGEITFIDEEGKEIQTHIESFESQEKNPILKKYEEKTQKYLAYEAAAKMFYPTEDYESRGKCPIMSLLTSES